MNDKIIQIGSAHASPGEVGEGEKGADSREPPMGSRNVWKSLGEACSLTMPVLK